jgi:hypothetical protein
MAAGDAILVVHAGMRRRGQVVVATERHAGGGNPLHGEPQQQEAENKVAQRPLHGFCAGFGSMILIKAYYR